MGRAGSLDVSIQQRRFLACFAACASVTRAARWTHINRTCHYARLREDPTYEARFKEAERVAARTLEDEAVRRAHEGLHRAVRYKGKVVGYESEYTTLPLKRTAR